MNHQQPLSPLSGLSRLLFVGGMCSPVVYILLALAVVLFAAGAANHALLLAAGSVFYMALTALSARGDDAVNMPLVRHLMKTGWQLAGVAVLVFALWALWFYLNKAGVENIWLRAAPWLLAFTPFYLIFGAVRAFKAQVRQLAAKGVRLSHPVVLHRLATIDRLLLARTGVVTPENLTIQVMIMPDGKPVLLKGLDFDASQRKNMWRAAAVGTLCNQAAGEGAGLSGDGLDMAFMRFARRMNLSREALLRRMPLQNFLPFDPEKRFEASFHRLGKKTVAAVKGAPEEIANLCGTPKAEWLHEVENLAQGGYRTIAVAGGEVAKPDAESLKGKLEFLGLIALVDPLKNQAAESISACQVAGIKVNLLSGDHPATTLATAKDLNIAARNDEVVSGDDLSALKPDSTQFANSAADARAFARLTPTQKANVTAACVAKGHVTAVYGHTGHDDPALSAASVQIRSERQGGKEKPADVYLAKGDITLLPEAIKHGRLAVANARKAARFTLALLVAQAGALVGFAFLGVPQALSAAALLWVNLFVVALLILPFAREGADKTLMRRMPRPASEPLLNNRTLGQIMLDGAIMAAIVVGVTLWQLDAALIPVPFGQALPLNLLVAVAALYVFFARAGARQVLKIAPWKNPLMWVMVAVVIALQTVIIFNGQLLHDPFGNL